MMPWSRVGEPSLERRTSIEVAMNFLSVGVTTPKIAVALAVAVAVLFPVPAPVVIAVAVAVAVAINEVLVGAAIAIGVAAHLHFHHCKYHRIDFDQRLCRLLIWAYGTAVVPFSAIPQRLWTQIVTKSSGRGFVWIGTNCSTELPVG